jgi:Xaa-Pro aminopeptidase
LSEVLYAQLDKYKNAEELERDIIGGFLKGGGAGYSFDPVVAAGKNAAIIHYDQVSQPLTHGDLIVVDVGCQYSLYGSDIARTVSYGQASARQRAVSEAVSYVQKEAFKLIKPGMIHKDYEKQVEIMVGEQLKQLGVIKSISRKAVRKHYPHYCSHSLGLDTHDSADYSQPLPENMVMTVEPGIYLPQEGIGVRIEDVVRITKDGVEIMSRSLPSGLKR